MPRIVARTSLENPIVSIQKSKIQKQFVQPTIAHAHLFSLGFNPTLEVELYSQGMANDHWRPSIYTWVPITLLQINVSSNACLIAPEYNQVTHDTCASLSCYVRYSVTSIPFHRRASNTIGNKYPIVVTTFPTLRSIDVIWLPSVIITSTKCYYSPSGLLLTPILHNDH